MFDLRIIDPGFMHERISQNFTGGEFRCKCPNCVKKCAYVSEPLLKILQTIRFAARHPIIVTSAWRCAAHNAAVGGVKRSYHCMGLAVDIQCPDIDISTLHALCRQLCPGGVGLYDDFVHIDIGTSYPRNWDERTK